MPDISSPERALIASTLVVYHPKPQFSEIWYFYPIGFKTGWDKDANMPVYLTDPSETPPSGFTPLVRLSYFAKPTRSNATQTLRDIIIIFQHLYETMPLGVLSIPSYVVASANEIPATLPSESALPTGWRVYRGDSPRSYPLTLES